MARFKTFVPNVVGRLAFNLENQESVYSKLLQDLQMHLRNSKTILPIDQRLNFHIISLHLGKWNFFTREKYVTVDEMSNLL